MAQNVSIMSTRLSEICQSGTSVALSRQIIKIGVKNGTSESKVAGSESGFEAVK